MPQPSLSAAVRPGRPCQRALWDRGSAAASWFRTLGVSNSSQTTDHYGPEVRRDVCPETESKKMAPKIGAISKDLERYVRAVRLGGNIKRRSGECRRCGSSSPHRPAAGGRSRPSAGQTGSRWVQNRKRQCWTFLSPLFGVDSRSLRSRDNLRIPDTSDNFFVCIAAFSILQRTKTGYLRSR